MDRRLRHRPASHRKMVHRHHHPRRLARIIVPAAARRVMAQMDNTVPEVRDPVAKAPVVTGRRRRTSRQL
jgi:hypothetical protein